MPVVRTTAIWNGCRGAKRSYTSTDRYIVLRDEFDLLAARELEEALGLNILMDPPAESYNLHKAVGIVIPRGSSQKPSPQDLDELRRLLRAMNNPISARACQLRSYAGPYRQGPVPPLKPSWLEPIVLETVLGFASWEDLNEPAAPDNLDPASVGVKLQPWRELEPLDGTPG
mgnify:CR=1 FL=1